MCRHPADRAAKRTELVVEVASLKATAALGQRGGVAPVTLVPLR